MSLMTLYDDDDTDTPENKVTSKNDENLDSVELETTEDTASSVTKQKRAVRVSPLRRSSRSVRSRARLMYPTRSRHKVKRNLTNRKGSYLARRIARSVPLSSKPRKGRDWTLKEKAKLLKALQIVDDPEDYESVASHIVSRTAEEVKLFVQGREKHMMRNKSYYLELFNMTEPTAPAPLSQWANICSHNSSENISKALHEVLKLASFEPRSVSEMRLDFSLIYNYLANAVADKELPELSPLEACILWDTISDINSSSAVQSNPECVSHLKRQFNALTAHSTEVKLSAGCYTNVKEMLHIDKAIAYQSALTENIIKRIDDLGNCSIKTGKFKGRRKPQPSVLVADTDELAQDSSFYSEEMLQELKEYSKLKDCISEMTGVQLISPRIRERKVADLAAEAKKVRDQLDKQCYSALNPLSLPATFLSHQNLIVGSTLSLHGNLNQGSSGSNNQEQTEIQFHYDNNNSSITNGS